MPRFLFLVKQIFNYLIFYIPPTNHEYYIRHTPRSNSWRQSLSSGKIINILKQIFVNLLQS